MGYNVNHLTGHALCGDCIRAFPLESLLFTHCPLSVLPTKQTKSVWLQCGCMTGAWAGQGAMLIHRQGAAALNGCRALCPLASRLAGAWLQPLDTQTGIPVPICPYHPLLAERALLDKIVLPPPYCYAIYVMPRYAAVLLLPPACYCITLQAWIPRPV